jgi:hypothetical protein
MHCHKSTPNACTGCWYALNTPSAHRLGVVVNVRCGLWAHDVFSIMHNLRICNLSFLWLVGCHCHKSTPNACTGCWYALNTPSAPRLGVVVNVRCGLWAHDVFSIMHNLRICNLSCLSNTPFSTLCSSDSVHNNNGKRCGLFKGSPEKGQPAAWQPESDADKRQKYSRESESFQQKECDHECAWSPASTIA